MFSDKVSYIRFKNALYRQELDIIFSLLPPLSLLLWNVVRFLCLICNSCLLRWIWVTIVVWLHYTLLFGPTPKHLPNFHLTLQCLWNCQLYLILYFICLFVQHLLSHFFNIPNYLTLFKTFYLFNSDFCTLHIIIHCRRHISITLIILNSTLFFYVREYYLIQGSSTFLIATYIYNQCCKISK